MYYSDEEKVKLVKLISASRLPIKKAAKEYGISDASFYTWRKQLQAAAIQDGKETEPDSEPQKSDEEKTLLALKEEFPYFGAVKLSKQLFRNHGLNLHPGKVKRILDQHGFEQERLPKAPPKGSRRFERISPRELYQMDIMFYRLKKEGRFYLVSIMDDYSRFIVAHKVCTTQTGDNITSVFHEAVDKYGLPNQLLTDRGSQFASWKGINAFQEMLGNLGVEHILTKSQSPQCIGKLESFHRNIQKELLRRKEFATIKEAEKAIDGYVEHYNFERVHMGIGYLVPADRFFNTERAVEETVEKAASEKTSFYLTGKLDGQPVRLLMNRGGTVTVYLAGQAVKELRSAAQLKELLL